jgi:hypothetical protein
VEEAVARSRRQRAVLENSRSRASPRLLDLKGVEMYEENILL